MRFIGQFFFLVLIVSFVELTLLIEVSQRFGLLFTLASCILTGVVGGALVRRQGLNTLVQIQQKMGHGQLPAQDVLAGVMLLIVGFLLITPGFMTDVLGFLVLIPPLRHAAAQLIYLRFKDKIQTVPTPFHRTSGTDETIIIETEGRPVDEPKDPV